MKAAYKILLSVLLMIFLAQLAAPQRKHGARATKSGGPLIFEQAAFDVKSYDITAKIDPRRRSISGTTTIRALIVHPTNWFVFDLDLPYQISAVSEISDGMKENTAVVAKLKFERRKEKIWAQFSQTKQPGEIVTISISYSGKPRVAPNPPWVGGFMWKKTADGSDWIAITCQNDGPDLWYPAKDHPSDEPDSVSLHITVPEDLYVASVGKLQKIEQHPNKTKTYHWLMSNSINNYNVVLNIAPYKIVEQNYQSISGETFPIKFYALPESVEKAKDIVAQTKKFLKFYEKFLGPYPYRKEKLGIAETPHLGMEHSTIIAYGNKFRKDSRGFDWLMLHELGHEWWGNMVTASDWRDMWIHEGFQSFMDSLYIEETKGRQAYFNSMKNRFAGIRNKQAVAPRESKFSYQIYFSAPDYVHSDGDIYGKGALILHSLRYLVGDDAFFRSLRRMSYPTKRLETIVDGKQNRFVTTDDFKQIVEKESKMELDWFFEVYLRQPRLPKLIVKKKGSKYIFRWETPNDLPFPMPIDIKRGGATERLKMPNGRAEISVEGEDIPLIDPNGWILKKRPNKAK